MGMMAVLFKTEQYNVQEHFWDLNKASPLFHYSFGIISVDDGGPHVAQKHIWNLELHQS